MSLDFKIGTPVYSREGKIGKLSHLVVDLYKESIDSIIVQRDGLLRKDIVVPVSWVEKADKDGVVLDAYLPELETLPEFRPYEYQALDPTARPIDGHPPQELLVWVGPYPHEIYITERPQIAYRGRVGVGEDEVVIRRGEPVYSNDGHRVATLDHMLVDRNTFRIQHLVVHLGHRLQRGEEIIVPADAVSHITDEGIHLTLNRDELSTLDRYEQPASDAQLEDIITKGLQTQSQTSGQSVSVQMDRGLARLFGEASEAVASAASSIASKVQGVIGVEDHTSRPPEGHASPAVSSGDQALAGQVTDALHGQRQEDLSSVSVQVDQGVAHLSGTTPTIRGKALAEQVAKSVPGVTSVVNTIMPDSTVRARVEAALAEDPRTGSVPIDVISRAGVVTLLGEVKSLEAKQAAEEIARSTPGVTAVINELDVCPEKDFTHGDFVPSWR